LLEVSEYSTGGHRFSPQMDTDVGNRLKTGSFSQRFPTAIQRWGQLV